MEGAKNFEETNELDGKYHAEMNSWAFSTEKSFDSAVWTWEFGQKDRKICFLDKTSNNC